MDSRSFALWGLGEAPGKLEDEVGKVFIGSAGQYLDMGLRDAAIVRSHIFLWNIFTKRPPDNDIGYYFQDPGSLPHQCTIPTFEGEMAQNLSSLSFLKFASAYQFF